MDMETLRGFERLMVVAVGGLSIFLGYLLFRHMPTRADSQGKVVLPGGISIFLSRVGPGIFFALFGAAVVAASFRFQVQMAQTARTVLQTAATTEVREMTRTSTQFGQVAGAEAEELAQRRVRLRAQIAFLNQLPAMLRPGLSRAERSDVATNVKLIKLELTDKVWGDWGDRRMFADWVMRGATGAPPPGLVEAATYFRYGQKEDIP